MSEMGRLAVAPVTRTALNIALTEAAVDVRIAGLRASVSSVFIAGGDGCPSITRGRQWADRAGREQRPPSKRADRRELAPRLGRRRRIGPARRADSAGTR